MYGVHIAVGFDFGPSLLFVGYSFWGYIFSFGLGRLALSRPQVGLLPRRFAVRSRIYSAAIMDWTAVGVAGLTRLLDSLTTCTATMAGVLRARRI